MEPLSTLLALCEGNQPITHTHFTSTVYPYREQVMGSFDVFFLVRLKKNVYKQTIYLPGIPLIWYHCNDRIATENIFTTTNWITAFIDTFPKKISDLLHRNLFLVIAQQTSPGLCLIRICECHSIRARIFWMKSASCQHFQRDWSTWTCPYIYGCWRLLTFKMPVYNTTYGPTVWGCRSI